METEKQLVKLTVYVREPLRRRLKAVAATKGVTVTSMIEGLVERELDRLDKVEAK